MSAINRIVGSRRTLNKVDEDGPAGGADGFLLEDDTGFILLEDDSGYLTQED